MVLSQTWYRSTASCPALDSEKDPNSYDLSAHERQ